MILSREIVGDDDSIPTEADLAKRFGVSRATVREALSQLTMAGVIVRKHGVGNFINRTLQKDPGAVWSWLDLSPSFMDLIRLAGQRGESILLDSALLAAGSLAATLEIGTEDEVLCFDRIILANGIRVIYSRTLMPAALIDPFVLKTILSKDWHPESVYDFMERQCHHKVTHQTTDIRAVAATPTLAQLLQCRGEEPLLRLEEVGYDQNQTPLFHALNHFRSDQVSFRQLRRPIMTINVREPPDLSGSA